MKKELWFLIPIVILLFVFGCTSNTTPQGTKNETILQPTQGIDILKDKLVVSEMSPGSIGTISLTVRDNLGGVTAKDIIVGLDNLGIFKVVECGEVLPSDAMRTCNGVFGYDKFLPVSQRGLPSIYPGQEINFRWRIKAPSEQELGYIALTHPLYYYLEYTYFTSSSQSIAFMSQQELLRREQSGENTTLQGNTKLSAGEITVDLKTQQPIIYYYTYPNSNQKEPSFDFTLVYDVENVGNGFPISDLLIVTHLPNGIQFSGDPRMQNWYLLNDPSCKVSNTVYFNGFTLKKGTLSCKDWIKYVFGEDTYKKLNDGKTYVYVVSYTSFSSNGYRVPMNLQITSSEMTSMKENNVPMKFFTFQSYVVYRYYKEGEININVYPLRI